MKITENQLDVWVRGNAQAAQGLVVELVWRLVAASSPRPKERRFPLADSIGQPGPDGLLDTDFPFAPFVPEGRSYWEIGTGLRAGAKATIDYTDLTPTVPAVIRNQSAFIFVTPLSARRDWEHTWKEDAQARWQEDRRGLKEWNDVRVIDGTKLIDWLHDFPSVQSWLAAKMGFAVDQIESPEQRWNVLRTIGDPPPLTPRLFLVGRDDACAKIKEIFTGTTTQLKLDTHFPDQMVDCVGAFVAEMEPEARIDAVGRCVIVSGVDGWNQMCAHRERHILVANFDLDESGGVGTMLLEKARRAGHAVVFRGKPGGIPHPNCVAIPGPKTYQVQEALEGAGYNPERARMLAHKSGGDLSSLLRCLQNLSLVPGWAEGTVAAELAVAELLGAWNEGAPADRAIVEGLSGKAYGEWIGKIREIALRPGTPLTQQDGLWKVVARYEGWYALGPQVFDEHLDRLRQATVAVLRERNPALDLPRDQRYAANVHGKVLEHSQAIRSGLAETLALLGSHSKALTSCSLGKRESTSALAVREILMGEGWNLWASLNDVLPLLAEAAPREFLDAVERALMETPCPFDALFAEEGSTFMGTNYMTGLLWALETLAWDPEYLTRVVIILGEFVARDPGGSWGNRPDSTLATILLPWLPQTCASLEKRAAAVRTLLNESPETAWKLILNLLPRSHQTSSGSRKPAWRETIDDNCSRRVTVPEYWDQVAIYAVLAIEAAKTDVGKLASLIERLDDLPATAHQELLVHLGSEEVRSLPEEDRVGIWNQLEELTAKHTKFSDAEWAMGAEQVQSIAAVAKTLAPQAPALRHRRLFSEQTFWLDDAGGDYEAQQSRLEDRRRNAVREISDGGGVSAIVDFARTVEAPLRVGSSFGLVAPVDVDSLIFPDLLEDEEGPLPQFVGGFTWGRFRGGGWPWVDRMDTSQWRAKEIGQFLAYLPFIPMTWDRAVRLLGPEVRAYWTRANANPFETDSNLEEAVDRLIEHGRPHAAIRCLEGMRYKRQVFDPGRAVNALLAAVESTEAHATDAHQMNEIIRVLQDDVRTDPEDLARVEWAYLPVLDGLHGAFPKVLERRLAEYPEFFCAAIRLVFRSKNESAAGEPPTDTAKRMGTNAYGLLNRWRTPPGLRRDGGYDGEALTAWLSSVRRECEETGHLEVAMTIVGHVLTRVPADQDGLWIHRAAAAALNARNANAMRDGFTVQLFNARGVHGFTAGRAERELAAKYRSQADAVEAAGFHRLADALRKLGASYEHDAERESARDPFDD